MIPRQASLQVSTDSGGLADLQPGVRPWARLTRIPRQQYISGPGCGTEVMGRYRLDGTTEALNLVPIEEPCAPAQAAASERGPGYRKRTPRRRSAFVTTVTLKRAIAPAARIGSRRTPVKGAGLPPLRGDADGAGWHRHAGLTMRPRRMMMLMSSGGALCRCPDGCSATRGAEPA